MLDTERDARPRVLLAQLGQPVVEAFGGGVEGLAPAAAGAGVDEGQVGLGVGTVQADEPVEGVRFHGVVGIDGGLRAHPQA